MRERVRRHRLINAVRLPEPGEPYRPKLDRPLTLKDVLKRHPEWKRRLEITLRAKLSGRDVPSFPLLGYCPRCEREFFPRTRPPFYKLCPQCRPVYRRKR